MILANDTDVREGTSRSVWRALAELASMGPGPDVRDGTPPGSVCNSAGLNRALRAGPRRGRTPARVREIRS